MLHFLMFSKGLGSQNPKFSGALRAPERLHSLMFSKVFGPQKAIIFRRASRAGNMVFPKVFQAF